jgi:hypothetical protein
MIRAQRSRSSRRVQQRVERGDQRAGGQFKQLQRGFARQTLDLNQNPYAIWASGATGTSSVGAGYTAYGRTFTAGVRFGF